MENNKDLIYRVMTRRLEVLYLVAMCKYMLYLYTQQTNTDGIKIMVYVMYSANYSALMKLDMIVMQGY